jgi:hypothetical protein
VSIRPIRELPCWQLNDPITGQPPSAENGEGWAHYESMTRAISAWTELVSEFKTPNPDWSEAPDPTGLVVAQSFTRPCVGLYCDGPDCSMHDVAIDCSGEGWTHLDPDDPLPMDLEDLEMVAVDDPKTGALLHYHWDCAPTEEDEPTLRPPDSARISPAQTAIPW